METTLEKPQRKYGEGGIRQLAPDRWQISFYDAQGRRRRESFKTEEKARKALDSKLDQRDTGKLDAHDPKLKLDVLADSYKIYVKISKPKSHDWIELVWRCHLEPFFGGRVAGRIGSDLFQEYIDARLEAKAATSTVNRELSVLKAIFRHGAKSEPPKILRVPNFPEHLREPDARTGFVTDKQYAALQANCKYGWLRALLAVGYNLGFRKGELLGLRVSQIDLEARWIHLLPGSTKNDKGRTVPMTDEIHGLLSECVKDKQPGDSVFTWGDGRPVKDFRATWDALTKAAGQPGLLIHDLRRSAVRRMVRRGISKLVAKKISGHITDSIFDRYDIVDENDLKEAAKKLA